MVPHIRAHINSKLERKGKFSAQLNLGFLG
jgi:hypothetical protein